MNDDTDAVCWDVRYEWRFDGDGSWFKARCYVYGDLDQVTGYLRGMERDGNHCVLSMRMRPKIRLVVDLTRP